MHGISFKIQSFNVRNEEFIMHEKDPVISVIMGIYNCGDTLSDAIECIVNQTFSDWELIMCDDGSNDDTYEIAISYKKK